MANRPDPRYLPSERTDARYLERWWHHDPKERYWLEMTDRDAVGSTIEGPIYDASGDRRNPAYLLALREVQVGDIVFHFDLKQKAIVACSKVEDPLDQELIDEDILDGEPWWTIHLTGTMDVSEPVTLDELRRNESQIAEAIANSTRRNGHATPAISSSRTTATFRSTKVPISRSFP